MIHKQLLLSFKCKKEYKKCEYHEKLDLYMFGRQHIYMMKSSDLYKNLGIKPDTKWLNHVKKESDTENMSSNGNEHDVFPSTSSDNYCKAS